MRQSPRTFTRAIFWRIPHNDPQREDIRLKLGRYTRNAPTASKPVPETAKPKSELTLDDEEFRSLIRFLEENYEPFRVGEHRYVPVSSQLSAGDIKQLRAIFEDTDRRRVVDLVVANRLLPDEVVAALQIRARRAAVDEFRGMLADDLREHDWQEWFTKNEWVFGSEFVRVLDEREIDTARIADYLMEGYDGFLDIIEIKRPEGGLRFWAEQRDHGNLVPAMDLVKAITQVTRYLYEVEQEANSVKFLDRVGVRAVKPRATLVFGRSAGWENEQNEAYRILNRGYHDLTIMTYDHVLQRAERILAGKDVAEREDAEEFSLSDDDDLPF